MKKKKKKKDLLFQYVLVNVKLNLLSTFDKINNLKKRKTLTSCLDLIPTDFNVIRHFYQFVLCLI